MEAADPLRRDECAASADPLPRDEGVEAADPLPRDEGVAPAAVQRIHFPGSERAG